MGVESEGEEDNSHKWHVYKNIHACSEKYETENNKIRYTVSWGYIDVLVV